MESSNLGFRSFPVILLPYKYCVFHPILLSFLDYDDHTTCLQGLVSRNRLRATTVRTWVIEKGRPSKAGTARYLRNRLLPKAAHRIWIQTFRRICRQKWTFSRLPHHQEGTTPARLALPAHEWSPNIFSSTKYVESNEPTRKSSIHNSKRCCTSVALFGSHLLTNGYIGL